MNYSAERFPSAVIRHDDEMVAMGNEIIPYIRRRTAAIF